MCILNAILMKVFSSTPMYDLSDWITDNYKNFSWQASWEKLPSPHQTCQTASVCSFLEGVAFKNSPPSCHPNLWPSSRGGGCLRSGTSQVPPPRSLYYQPQLRKLSPFVTQNFAFLALFYPSSLLAVSINDPLFQASLQAIPPVCAKTT